MITVNSGARLHFSLIDLNGSLGRIDGSVGLGIQRPDVLIEIEKSSKLKVDALGRTKEVKELCNKIIKKYNLKKNFSLNVRRQIPLHSGLGSTTQLYLSVAKALLEFNKIKISSNELSLLTKRGGTSGVGVSSFSQGGFIVDSGHSFKKKSKFLPSAYSNASPPPVASRLDFPDWSILLCVPLDEGLHGKHELDYFQTKFPASEREAENISRILLMKMIPSVLESNLTEFDESMKLLNKARSFKYPKQTLKLINEVNKAGGKATSMTSFGPTVFTFTDTKKKAEKIKKTMQGHGFVVETGARNTGSIVRKH